MTLHKIQKQILILMITILVLGCGTLGRFQKTQTPAPPTLSPPSATPTSPTEADIMEAIQATSNNFAQAYNQNDIELLATTLDLENKAFSRFIKTRFTTDMESYGGAKIHETYAVDYITQREYN